MATVGKHDGGTDKINNMSCHYIIVDGNGKYSLWSTLGRGNKRPDDDYPWDAVADAKLTLPLKVGQRVIRRDGTVATIEEGITTSIVKVGGTDGHAVFVETGVCSGHSREEVEKDADQQNYWDVMADAPDNKGGLDDTEVKPVAKLDWNKPLAGFLKDGTEVKVKHHGKTAPSHGQYQRSVHFDPTAGIKTKTGAIHGFCYTEEGRHYREGDDLPVIRNI